jgi:hypothetical protein
VTSLETPLLIQTAVEERGKRVCGNPGAHHREAREASTRTSSEMWASGYEIFHKLIGLSAVNPEAQRVVEPRDAERRSAMALVVERLRREGYHSPAYSDEQARALLTLLTSFANFDSLYGTSRLSVDDVARLLIDLMQVVMR